ncbi:hypothetical protein MM326_09745 [Alkalihalobacillus sp. LMS6]|uniref:hypothetical protein n=1 Tax=Alkalihalobacillus sp. LMS6 TaxID=2924034 RepID=UPI0020D1093D|nr:hypothetical protein [Alkalihalobacillus sp. LMS6]UTR08272.1 hypothetical protein MM326_09745 [Alkalihalobacillus sp. LMS6]
MSFKKHYIFGALVATVIICLTVLLIARVYFNSQEITAASEECLQANGIIHVEKGFLNLTYSFMCVQEAK